MTLRAAWPVLVMTVACMVPPEEPAAPGAFEDVRRVIATLDDVAGEYRAQVAATRMRVMTRQLHDATVFARRMPADEQAALLEIEASIAAREDPDEVVAAARALRRRLLDSHHLVLGPGSPPSRARGEQLWRMLCAGCHGSTGAGDGEQGLYLLPEPKDFHDAEILSTLAPSRAFSRISDGVPGTDMPQWGLFSTAERWALASLVFSFRHDAEAAARGEEVVARLDLPRSPRALADRTDADLLVELEARGLDAHDSADALAHLRGTAAFAVPPGPLAGVRGGLADALVEYRAGRRARAATRAANARAELAERRDAIRLSDPEAAALLEHRVLRIRRGIADAALAETLEREIVRADVLIDRAEASLRAPSALGGVRLALLDGLAAAVGLGLLVAPRRPTRRRILVAASTGLLVGAFAAGSMPPGTALVGWCMIAPVALLVIARAIPSRMREELRVGAAAALVGVSIAAQGRAVVGVLGTAGLLPWLAGAGALGVVALGARWVGLRARWPRTWGTTVAFAIAAAGAAGRGAWLVTTDAASAPSLLAVWRIDAVGMLPATAALAAAAVAALAVLAASARNVCADKELLDSLPRDDVVDAIDHA